MSGDLRRALYPGRVFVDFDQLGEGPDMLEAGLGMGTVELGDDQWQVMVMLSSVPMHGQGNLVVEAHLWRYQHEDLADAIVERGPVIRITVPMHSKTIRAADDFIRLMRKRGDETITDMVASGLATSGEADRGEDVPGDPGEHGDPDGGDTGEGGGGDGTPL